MTIAGQMEAARTGAGNFMVARVNNGAPLISIATIAQVSPFFVLSPKAKPLSEPKTFTGRKIAWLRSAARWRDAEPHDATRGCRSGERGEGEGGGFAGELCPGRGRPHRRLHGQHLDDGEGDRSVPECTGSGWTTACRARSMSRHRQIEKNEAAYVAFLRAVHRAASAILDAKDTEPLIREIGKLFQISASTIWRPPSATLPRTPRLGRQGAQQSAAPRARTGPAVKLMHDAQMLKSAPDATTLYTNALLDKALK